MRPRRTQRDIKPIHAAADHRAALREVLRLVDLDPDVGTADGDRLDVLFTLVEACARKHFRMDAPDPIEAIKFSMEQRGLTVHDLAPRIGRTSRVYEVLARKRPLTLATVRRLHTQLGIPAESLIGV